MIHLVLLFYLAALFIGFLSLGVSIHLAVAFRHKAVRLFIAFLASLLTVIFALLVRTFGGPGEKAFFGSFSLAVMSLGCLLYVSVAPFFFHALVGRPVGRARRAIFVSLSAALGAAAIVYFFIRLEAILFFALIPSLFLTLGYGIVVILLNLRHTADPFLRRALRVFCVVSALFLPLLSLDAVYDRIPFLAPLAPFGLVTLPAYFIAVNLLCLFFAEGRFNHPVFWENGRISAFFAEKYGITEREGDIIALLMEGGNTAAIAERLFISPKTVENHISNIYRKTGVKNRVQLLNLIQTNS